MKAIFEVIEPSISIKDIAHYYSLAHNFGKVHGRSILACPAVEKWWYFAVSTPAGGPVEIVCGQDLAALFKAIEPEVKNEKVTD